MHTSAVLHEFVDDELLRAPMTIDLVSDAVQEHWRLLALGLLNARGPADPARVLRMHRGELATAAVRALREAVAADLQRRAPQGNEATAVPRHGGLSLIDEDDVTTDIAISRCIETVKLHAEATMRELQTYTATLVGDTHMARDTNPLRPEVFVRALWQGVLTLPLPRERQAAYLVDGAQALAEALEQAYAAAIDRLVQRGVTPAAHRTIVMLGSAYTTRSRHGPPRDLNVLRDSLRMPLAPVSPRAAANAIAQVSSASEVQAAVAAAATALAEPPPEPSTVAADPQLIGLLSRLFDEIQANGQLPGDLGALLRRLQPAALRVAMRDPSMLDSYGHPVWQLMDQLAHAATMASQADRLRVLGLARSLVLHLAGNEVTDRARFDWAIERVETMNNHLLTRALHGAAPAIAAHRQPDAQRSTHDAAPLDVGSMDTVPSDLLPDEPAGAPAAPPLDAGPGEHLHAYLQGKWRVLQVLAVDDAAPLWVLRETANERLWALRPEALERLAAARLAKTMKVRSLVRRAAERVLRGG